MIVVRPSTLADVDGVLAMLRRAGDALNGMSSLRPDRDRIRTRITNSVEAFEADIVQPGEEDYFFVAEDPDASRLVGTGAVIAAVGLTEAFYSYKVITRVYASRELDVYNRIDTLVLSNDYTGTSEVASLFVDAEYRSTRTGKLMSLSRMLFIAEHPKRFDERVFAEMRGFQTEDGTAPFWEGLGRHFFSISFAEADELSALGHKEFIAELMPYHPIYVPLLPPDAQKVIGQVHPSTVPALRMLEKEGFRFHGYVDIFDAGPTIEARVTDLRAVKESKVLTAKAGPSGPGPDLLVTNRGLGDFRSTLATGDVAGDTVVLAPEVLEALAIVPGDTVRVMALDARSTHAD